MARATQRRTTNTREDAEETKRTILRAAQQLFMEYGYRAVSTRQIADACGLTQPALYHYFADKQTLYVAVVQDELDRMRSALERIAGRSESVEERLRHVVLFLLGVTRHNLSLMLHDIRYELSPEQQAVLNEAFQFGVIGPISSIFSDGLRQGLLHDHERDGVDPIVAAGLLMNMVASFLGTGRASDTKNERSVPLWHPATESDLAQLIVHILLYGLAGQHP
jgi:AcrR family transcriptional regulator